jgi:hypothetical protein
MATAESNNGRDADGKLLMMASDLISDHLLYLILVVAQGEVDVRVHAAELDCSLVIGPGIKQGPENKVYSDEKSHISS